MTPSAYYLAHLEFELSVANTGGLEARLVVAPLRRNLFATSRKTDSPCCCRLGFGLCLSILCFTVFPLKLMEVLPFDSKELDSSDRMSFATFGISLARSSSSSFAFLPLDIFRFLREQPAIHAGLVHRYYRGNYRLGSSSKSQNPTAKAIELNNLFGKHSWNQELKAHAPQPSPTWEAMCPQTMVK